MINTYTEAPTVGEEDLRRFLLPKLKILFGNQVHGLWKKYLDTSSLNLSSLQIFDDDDEIAKGSLLSRGFRNSLITEGYLQYLFLDKAEDAIHHILTSDDDIFCKIYNGQEITFSISNLLSQSILEFPLNYNLPFDIPGNIAGGTSEGNGMGGWRGQALDDSRNLSGNIKISKISEGWIKVDFDLKMLVVDTVDFIPGGFGTTLEQIFTRPLHLLEMWDRAYDVPFAVSFSPEIDPLTILVLNNTDCDCPDDDCDPTLPSPPTPPTLPGQPGGGGSAGNIFSWDPNKKIGPKGVGSNGFITSDQLMAYKVYFENEPNATAAALEVRVEDPLDTDLDWTTFELLSVGFGDYEIAIPSGMTHYETTMDVNGWTWDDVNDWHTGETPLMVDLKADLDIATGKVTWNIKSYDPATGWEPEDVYAGFLPPDDSNDITKRGEGYVSFLIYPKKDLPSGTQIENMADIYFDTNPVIETPLVVNVIDSDGPTSNVLPLAATIQDISFTVNWVGQDGLDGSGIASYDIYVSTDGGDFVLWLDDTTATSDTFTGEDNHSYAFYSVAKDLIGYTEQAPDQPDAVTTVNLNSPPVANAGSDGTYECTSTAGAEMQLNGTGSTDPDGDLLTYEWTWSGGSANGVSPTVVLPMGLTAVTLTVSDGPLFDTDTVGITVVDTTPPVVEVIVPQVDTALQDVVTLTADAADITGVATVYFYLREPGGATGIPIGQEDLAGSLNPVSGKWDHPFDTTQLQDGYYIILAKAVDAYGNEGWSSVVSFSIRNWAVLEMLPATENNRAGRTMPVKFTLRITDSVDPAMPFVYNEELEIRIFDAADSANILQTSLYGISSKDYRINSDTELYITNFKTSKTPAVYEVEIWRTSNNFKVGSFTFSTVILGKGDFTGDGKTDGEDLAIITTEWLGSGLADIAPLPDGDGMVDFRDFALFAEQWLVATSP